MEVILTIRRLITLLLLINGCYVSSHVTSTGSQFSGHNVSPDPTPVPTSIDQPSMTASALEGSMTSSLDMMTHSDTSLASPDTVMPSFSVSPTLMPSASSASSASSAASAETSVDSLGTIGGITMSTDLKTESTGSVETAFSTNSTTILQTSPFESPLTATVSIGTSGTSIFTSSSLHNMLPTTLASNILSMSASFEYESEITNLISSTAIGEITPESHSSSITSEISSNDDINTLTSSISSGGLLTNDVTNTITPGFTYLTMSLPSTDSILINNETFQSESTKSVNTVSLESISETSSFISRYTDVMQSLSSIEPTMTPSLYYDTSSLDSSNSVISAYSVSLSESLVTPSIVPSITIASSSLNSTDNPTGLNSVTATFITSNNSPSSILDVFSSGFSDLVVKSSSVITESAEQPTDSSSLTGTINPSNFMDTTHYPEKTTIPSSTDTVVPTTMLDTVGTSTAMPILPSPTTSLPMPTSSLPVDETKPNADHNKGGLTNGGKAALGICIPIIIILVIVGIIYLFYRKRHYTASWKLSDVVSYRPWSYNNATYYDDESTLIIPSLK